MVPTPDSIHLFASILVPRDVNTLTRCATFMPRATVPPTRDKAQVELGADRLWHLYEPKVRIALPDRGTFGF